MQSHYLLPKLPAWFLGKLPRQLQSQSLTLLLNRLFADLLAEDELDFLKGKTVQINVSDANLGFALTLVNQRLSASQASADLTITGNTHDFLLLAARAEDPDTLFFQRRLRLEGDTNLGLYVKNFLDSVEPEEYFPCLQKLLERSLPIYERFIPASPNQ